jgi:hypothetical protein
MVPDAFDSQELVIDGMRVEGDVVLVSGPFRARGAGSGIQLSRESHSVFWVEDGLIRRMGTYFELDEAQAAAGFAPGEPST